MRKIKSKTISGYLVTLISILLTQISLFLIPCFFPATPLLIQLSLSVVVLIGLTAVGRCCKRLLGVRASASGFVFLNIVFSWGVYVGFLRKVITPRVDFLLNIEFFMLVIGLFRILSMDPGYATNGSSHVPKFFEKHASEVEGCDLGVYEFTAEERVRYCTHCEVYVREFDHHCPAFGNCIGQKNHALFIMLLIGFLCTEASYIACSLNYFANLHILDKDEHLSVSRNVVISTMIFSLLQVIWQGLFLAWHIYCVCFNIKTDEWINWKKYPEFHMIVYSEPGKDNSERSIRFRNPYNRGFIQNLKEFLVKSIK